MTAPAKVNLRLRVLGRRPDGFHEIDTLFQAIDLADDVGVRLEGEGIRLRVSGGDVGPERENLAYRAAARFAELMGRPDGVEIDLTKRVPAGAGLGGGSSDAAAVLRCLAEFAGVAREDPRLVRCAAALGSDVPFFLCPSPLARGRGRGERLEPLAPLGVADLVVVSPPVHVPTALAYAALAAARVDSTRASDEEAWTPTGWADVAARATNDLQAAIAARHPEIGHALSALRSAGAAFALMSGSGSSAFGLFPSAAVAHAVAEDLTRELGWSSRAVRTLQEWPSRVGR